MRTIIVAASIAFTACTSVDDTTLDVVYDPCSGFSIAAADDATADERAAIDAALVLWRDVLAIRDAPNATGGPAIPVRFEDAAAAFRGIYLDETGEVVINRRLSIERQTITIAHELGHAFGLWHVDDRISVMNEGNLTVVPVVEDAASIASLWPSCEM